jgi:threonine dehydratase
MISHELQGTSAIEYDADHFVTDALRCKSQYGHSWNQSMIMELSWMTRHGVFLVDDTHQEIGAFKIRGATVAVGEALHTSAGRLTSVCAASSGSFGMGIASSARRLGLQATVFMPANASSRKKQKIRSFGAAIDDSESTYEAAKDRARFFAAQRPRTTFIDGVGWEVFKGNATLAAEMSESGLFTRKRSAVLVPLGIGSLAVPTSLFLRGLGFPSDLFLVEPLTHCKFLAEHANGIQPTNADTIADGAAVRAIPDLVRPMLTALARTVIALTEQEIVNGMRFLWKHEHIQSEGAGALALGAFLAHPEFFSEYDQVWLIVTGRNVEPARFRSVLRYPDTV